MLVEVIPPTLFGLFKLLCHRVLVSSFFRRLIRKIVFKRHRSPSKTYKIYLNKRCNYHKSRLLDQNVKLCQKVVTLIQTMHWVPEQFSNRLKKEHKLSVSYLKIHS